MAISRSSFSNSSYHSSNLFSTDLIRFHVCYAVTLELDAVILDNLVVRIVEFIRLYLVGTGSCHGVVSSCFSYNQIEVTVVCEMLIRNTRVKNKTTAEYRIFSASTEP